MNINHFQLSKVGKIRKANEDFCGYDKTLNGHVFVVCDGMGGHVGGARASELGVKSIVEFFQKEFYDNLILAIDRSFQFANEQIFAQTLEDPSLKGMGTTVALLIIRDDDCFIGHIGDSRIYLKTDGELHRITKDHSFVQGLVDQGVITDEEAESHPKKNQILKALGHSLDVQGTICQKPIKVKTGDVFLLCSDGLNGMINDRYIEKCINSNNLIESGESLYQGAMNNRGADNISLILVGIEKSIHSSKSEFISFTPSRSPSTVYFFEKGKENEEQNFKQKPIQKRNKVLIGVLGIVLLISTSLITYITFIDKPPINLDETPTMEDRMTENDLSSKTLKELKELAEKRVKTLNIDNQKQITTKDKEKVKLNINKNEELVGVEKVEEIKKGIEDPKNYTAQDLSSKTLKELQELAEKKVKTINIANQKQISIKGNKNVKLKINNQKQLIGVEEVDSSNEEEKALQDYNKLPFIEIKTETKIDEDLIKNLKDNVLNKDELYELNKIGINNDNKWTQRVRNSYNDDKKVPQGFKLRYRKKK
jgi:serine/threonine protein phosphatase PrpC